LQLSSIKFSRPIYKAEGIKVIEHRPPPACLKCCRKKIIISKIFIISTIIYTLNYNSSQNCQKSCIKSKVYLYGNQLHSYRAFSTPYKRCPPYYRRCMCSESVTMFSATLEKHNLVPRVFLLGSKDPGRRWSRDLLKSSRFLISNPRSGQ
jgi:hypothetical protein